MTERSSGLEVADAALLLDDLRVRCGHDFREYAAATLHRRIAARIEAEHLRTVSELRARVRRDGDSLQRLVEALTVRVTAMFRDPSFHASFRANVVPLLADRRFFRVWHAGCASGEEAYSMAILLHEEGLLHRCRIYATDLSHAALARARAGIYPLPPMRDHTESYRRAGGARSFSEYYTARYEHAIMRPFLRDRIVFATHNLATDAAFQEIDVLLCRNVLIYFTRPLQDRVHDLFLTSLSPGGILALGRTESLRFTAREDRYQPLDARERIYRRVGEK
ncbi:MAG: protein-glutamate O-methyltransferase CheR [Candidatus Schekmanbacteria bacterium]|nr:protein-glutamate O-methyltransferase CheR [Candidatus Schekmanbacteria bacterium]